MISPKVNVRIKHNSSEYTTPSTVVMPLLIPQIKHKKGLKDILKVIGLNSYDSESSFKHKEVLKPVMIIKSILQTK